MCEPATIATAALVIGAVGTGVSTYSSVQQSRAARKTAQYNSAVAKNNAIISENLAQDAEKRGKVEEQRHRLKVAAFKAEQENEFAASGLDLTSTSFEQILSDTAALGELDALTIRGNAAREAYGYRTQGVNYEAQSILFLSLIHI